MKLDDRYRTLLVAVSVLLIYHDCVTGYLLVFCEYCTQALVFFLFSSLASCVVVYVLGFV